MIISTMEEEKTLEVEVEEPLEEDDVETSINGETIVSIHPIKEEVETILVLPTVAEKAIITTKREQIIVVFTVEILGTKQPITYTNIIKTWQQIHIKTPMSLMKVYCLLKLNHVDFHKTRHCLI